MSRTINDGRKTHLNSEVAGDRVCDVTRGAVTRVALRQQSGDITEECNQRPPAASADVVLDFIHSLT